MDYPINNVRNGWYADFHIHSHWSLDIPNGPAPEDYLEIAEEHHIHIGFLDHYEMLYEDNPSGPKDKHWMPEWPFAGEKWNQYLEKMDELKSHYNFVSSGLEVDYYPERETELRNFVDDYGDEFDLLMGTVHEVEPFAPITLAEDLKRMLKKHGSLEKVADIYFEIERRMLESKIFKAVAHIDTIYRFCNSFVPMKESYDLNPQIQEIADLCRKTDTWLEWNLSGFRYPIGRPFPVFDVIKKHQNAGGRVFIGSDTHSVDTLVEFIPRIKRAYDSLSE